MTLQFNSVNFVLDSRHNEELDDLTSSLPQFYSHHMFFEYGGPSWSGPKSFQTVHPHFTEEEGNNSLSLTLSLDNYSLMRDPTTDAQLPRQHPASPFHSTTNGGAPPMQCVITALEIERQADPARMRPSFQRIQAGRQFPTAPAVYIPAGHHQTAQIGTKKRIRINKKPPGGNNRYGRVGTFSCEQCRKRKSKCIYRSEWVSCDFCRSRKIELPCIKVGGPKKRVLPRPMPTALDAVVSAEDVLFLEFAHLFSSEWDSSLTAWLKISMVRWGPAVPFATLRQAILALSTSVLYRRGHIDRETAENHYTQACSALLRRLTEPSTIGNPDLIAVIVLCDVAFFMGNCRDTFIHAQGSRSMINALSTKMPASDKIDIFAPLAHDFAITYEINASLMTLKAQKIQGLHFPLWSSFGQRARYWNALGSVSDRRFSEGVPNAIKDTFTMVYQLLATCINLVVLRELGNIQDRCLVVGEILNWIANTLSEPEFQQSIEVITNRSATDFGKQLGAYYTLQLTSIRLVRSVLTSPSLLQGFNAPACTLMAKSFLSSYRLQTQDLCCIRDYVSNDLNNRAIMLVVAGVTLQAVDVAEYGEWILDEIGKLRQSQGMIEGYENEANALHNYWREKTLCNVAEVFKRWWKRSESQSSIF